jgi:hypothetical protein
MLRELRRYQVHVNIWGWFKESRTVDGSLLMRSNGK